MTVRETHNRMLLTVVLSVLALCALPRSVMANPLSGHVLASPDTDRPDIDRLVLGAAKPLSIGEMEHLRGGFSDPSGLIYQFAVNVQTLLNGGEVFTRSVVVTPSGINGALQATTSSNLLAGNIPSNLTVSLLNNGTGVIVTDINGNTTTLMNQTAGGIPASIILNTGSDRNVAQSVNVSLTLQNMASIMKFVDTASQGAVIAQHQAVRSIGF